MATKRRVVLLGYSLIVILAFATACATPYQRAGFKGGYEDMHLGDDVFNVSFRGNGYTGEDRVNQYFLRRCAEVTASNGYDYFIFVDQRATTTAQVIQTSDGSANTTGTVYGSNFNATTTYSPPSYTQVNRHRREGTIRVFKEGSQPPGSMRAQIILKNFEGN